MLLSETYEEIMAMINAIGAPVYLVDIDSAGCFVGLGMNSLAEESLGVSNEIFRGQDQEDFTGLSDSQRFRAQRAVSDYRRCVELRSNITDEAEIKLDDGTSWWGRHTCFPIFNESGEVRRLLITSIDITELKETEERLENALTRVLSGFVTICSTCKSIKEDSDQWVPVERYLSSDANDVQFSHGCCPKCYKSAIGEL